MKTKFTLIFTLLVALSASAQKHSVFNFGIGLPITFPEKTNSCSSISEISSKRLYLSIEKPYYLKTGENNAFSIRPGLGYFYLNEIYESSPCALGGYYEHQYNRTSFNIFTKFRYDPVFKKEKFNNYYFGAVAGMNYITKTKGQYFSRFYHSTPSEYSGKVNESGKDFFNTFFYGFFAGFYPRMEKSTRIRPGFEISVYPKFYTLRDKQKSLGMFSVNLAFQSKEQN